MVGWVAFEGAVELLVGRGLLRELLSFWWGWGAFEGAFDLWWGVGLLKVEGAVDLLVGNGCCWYNTSRLFAFDRLVWELLICWLGRGAFGIIRVVYMLLTDSFGSF